MTKNDRANFGSKLGVILASAGSAVGLGNIWRFPYETGNHGGAAFILIYLACVLILGIPIMVSEFLIGRHSRANTAGAYQKLAPGTQWRWIGRMGVLAGFLILSYYSVVAGWTLEFIGEAVTDNFAGKTSADYINTFNSFSSNPWRPVIWLVLFLLATHFIIVKGGGKRHREVCQNNDANAIYPVDYIGRLFYCIAGFRCRSRVSLETGMG